MSGQQEPVGNDEIGDDGAAVGGAPRDLEMTLLTRPSMRIPKAGLELSFRSSLGLAGIEAHSERAKQWLVDRFGEVTTSYESKLAKGIPNLGSVTVLHEVARQVEAEAVNMGFVTQWNPASQREIDLEKKLSERYQPTEEVRPDTKRQSYGKNSEIEKVRIEAEQRERARRLKEYRADKARKNIRLGFGVLLWLVAAALLGYGVYAGVSVTWNVRAADMTTHLEWESFADSLPGFISGLIVGLGAYLVCKN